MENINKIFYTMRKRTNNLKNSINFEQPRRRYLSLFNNKHFTMQNSLNNPKYVAYGFKDEYFPQRIYNTDRGINTGTYIQGESLVR